MSPKKAAWVLDVTQDIGYSELIVSGVAELVLRQPSAKQVSLFQRKIPISIKLTPDGR
jgi:hypothetical protein